MIATCDLEEIYRAYEADLSYSDVCTGVRSITSFLLNEMITMNHKVIFVDSIANELDTSGLIRSSVLKAIFTMYPDIVVVSPYYSVSYEGVVLKEIRRGTVFTSEGVPINAELFNRSYFDVTVMFPLFVDENGYCSMRCNNIELSRYQTEEIVCLWMFEPLHSARDRGSLLKINTVITPTGCIDFI